ncbi:MAG: methyltransferase domain-containing protein [Clostridiales bacterium]|nr:methyltransferase domain-containing protein [Clostridiales bacterium]
MERDSYRQHFELEEIHWWFAGRREIILAALDGLQGFSAEALILDAGCGTGLTLRILGSLGKTFGFDFKEEALRFCRKRDLERLVRADAQRMPFKKQAFDVVVILDVLSHQSIESDLDVLRNSYQILKKNGFLLVCESAFNFLFGPHDRALHVRERYTCRGMRKRLSHVGFEVMKSTYFNFFLFLPVAGYKLWDKLFHAKKQPYLSHLYEMNEKLNSLLFRIMRAEAPLLRHVRFPFGSSLLCIAKKK